MKKKMKEYTFSENNSGGSWWLKEKDYLALFKEGWKYKESDWDKKQGYDTKPFLSESGDTVPYGWRHNLVGKFSSIRDAVESFERATGRDFFEEGCNCCGAPFYIYGDKESLSGDSVIREVVRPW